MVSSSLLLCFVLFWSFALIWLLAVMVPGMRWFPTPFPLRARRYSDEGQLSEHDGPLVGQHFVIQSVPFTEMLNDRLQSMYALGVCHFCALRSSCVLVAVLS